jgi:hypothetical protein
MKPVKYQYRPEDLATRDSVIYVEWMGSGWAITKETSNIVFNKEGEWEYQPFPSSRTEEFYRRCRYQTPEEAVAKLQEHGL